jgi:Lon protease-like protein
MTPLPEIIPIFPLPGALLLPGGYLPLNIFEPRYLAMVEDAAESDKLIGMIQPKGKGVELHSTGCAGLIHKAQRTSDGRILIELAGLQRFQVEEELPLQSGYRRVRVRWLAEALKEAELDRPHVFPLLKKYLARCGMTCQWERMQSCTDSHLVTTLAMVCPFSPAEQQALLEADGVAALGRLLTSLMELAGAQVSGKPN